VIEPHNAARPVRVSAYLGTAAVPGELVTSVRCLASRFRLRLA
jgi:hypothetical protein